MAEARGSKSGQPIPELTEKDQDRYWNKVLFDVDCWWWTGSGAGQGYGGFSYGPLSNNRSLLAHRVAYRLTHGPIGSEMTVSHLCHNRRCVRPTHLIAESIKANLGRSITGERHPDARLTTEQVYEIRRVFDAGQQRVTQLADRYDVNPGTISDVVRRRTWRHLPEVPPSLR